MVVGLIQGVTELFPVSSLGHSVLIPALEVMGQQVFDILGRVYATGQSESLRDFRIQFHRPDLGEWVEIFVDFTVYPWPAADGSVQGVIVNSVDVTERVRERHAAQAQVAEARLRYERARDVIDALQRELLPTGLPVLPQLEVAAAYLLAEADTAAGGDWFDALPLPDGRVALMTGDVVGHGVAASAAMGQLRVVLRERLAATGEILATLDALNTAAAWIPGARAATVCVVLLNPVSGALSYCTAGHPPPLVLPAGDEGRFLPATGARPLGVGGVFTGEHVGTGRLERGGMVLLYTDGILERPGRSLAEASVELARAATDVAADRAFRNELPPAERVCVQTLELLTRTTGHSDDITMLTGCRVDPSAPLRLHFPARIEELAPLRPRLSEWLAGCGAGQADNEAVRHAVAELATNSMTHAYAGDGGDGYDCVVTADLDVTGELEMRVSDHGSWREPRPSSDSGYGMQMAAGLVDSLQVAHDEHGTTATLRHTLTRPARLLTAAQLSAGSAVQVPVQAAPLLVLDQPGASQPRVRVDGPLDAATSSEAESAVRAAGAVGTRGLTVDLTGVTHLGSAGVAALHRLAAEHGASDTSLRLYAPIGSPADLILTLVGLRYDTSDPDVSPDSGSAPEFTT